MALRFIGALLLLLVLAMGLARAPDRPVETLVARWALPPSEFIAVKGQVVHLRDEGPREDPLPVLLLHGTSSSLHTWEGWVKELAKTRRVITLDLPGFGLTGPFSGQYVADDYRGDTLARFVLDVMDARRVPKAVLGGNSLGGEVAWRVATLAPTRVGALALVDASGTAFTSESVPLGFWLARIPGVRWLGQYFTPRALVAQGIRNAYGDPARVSDALIDRYHELQLREGNRRALGLRVTQLERGEHLSRLDALNVPALIVWGELDRLIPKAEALVLQQRLRGSQVVVFPGLGHLPHEEDPAATLPAVKRFLATLPAEAAPGAR